MHIGLSVENSVGGMENRIHSTNESGCIEMAEYQEDQLLDCKGMLCPLPIVKTNKMIDSMETNQILKIVATDPASIIDMAAWSHRTGHELLESITTDNEFIFYVRKVA